MERKLTVEDARQSLTAHAGDKGAQVYEKYGPHIGWNELQSIMEDRTCVRYPCTIVFDTAGLHVGEMAHPEPLGENPEDGFKIFVHPLLMTRLKEVPAVVLYQLVLVNYGEFASAEDAEVFGANALGMSKEEYYNLLCGIADQVEEIAA
ncbi:MAG: hypothetical protein ACXWKG_11415 [Limisphaerales bacterium]